MVLPPYVQPSWLNQVIDQALKEDQGEYGDVTSKGTIHHDETSRCRLVAKASGVVSGLEVARLVFQRVDPETSVEYRIAEGAFVKKGTVFATIRGKTQAILTAERVALNFLQRCSGIATMTRRMVNEIKKVDSKTVLLDTRKTVPGLRFTDKMAVLHGGGQNHRLDLSKMVMIKDNHVDAAGGVENAIDRVRSYCRDKRISVPIEIETRSLEEVERVLKHGGVDRIMLDNFVTVDVHGRVNTSLVSQALELAGNYGPDLPSFEVSGNITLSTVGEVARTNVDFVSCGALTHSVEALDISLKFNKRANI